MTLRKLSVLIMMGALLGTAACDDDDDPTEPEPETFRATMTTFQEPASPPISPANSVARGSATVVFTDAGFTYDVSVQDITAITAAHIHTSQGGGVVFNLNPTITQATTSTVLAAGTATAASTFSAGFTVDSVKSLIRRGNAYVNVHTTGNPGGHIRGQLVQIN